MSDVLVVSFLSSVESIVTEYAKGVSFFFKDLSNLLLGHALLLRIVERNQTCSVLRKFNLVSCVNVERS